MIDIVELIFKLLPVVPIIIIGGGVLFLLKHDKEVYVFLKKWWKNRNKETPEEQEHNKVLIGEWDV